MNQLINWHRNQRSY